jgi:hypothetical protein
MRTLSKSKLIAFRQCPKRLWLEVHRPELRVDSPSTQAAFATGHTVGAIARELYDAAGTGTELDLKSLGVPELLDKTRELLAQRKPIFEAGFSVVTGKDQAALALADALLPDTHGDGWRMVEVKSTTKVKDYQRDDAAIQHFIASRAGVNLSGVALARIDSSWTYPGGGDYRGLLVEEDLTDEAATRGGEVQVWIGQAHQVVAKSEPPLMPLGDHCTDPFACGFSAICTAEDEALHGVAHYPVNWLPRIQAKALKDHIAEEQVRELADVPDDLLNPTQLRVKTQTLRKKTFFDAAGASEDLAGHKLPALFLDFETITYPVPVWAGTRPYQQIPFQFSLHRLYRTGRTEHTGFLDVSGQDPSAAFAKALIAACDGSEPVFVYSSFERTRLAELAARFPRSAARLNAISERLVDLLPITQTRYYHPNQQGSWSIKAVLPTVAPELRYSDLEGVQDGGGAQAAFLEAIDPATPVLRKEELRQQLWRYCRLDTFAMVRLWGHLAERKSFISLSDDASSAGAPL